MFATDHIWLRLRNVLRVFAGHSKVAQLRLRVAALEQSHAALLNAVPGNVALVDTEGGILAVNDTWRHFAVTNELPAATNFGISSNYFDVCGRSGSEEGELDSAVAAGIRNVLAGTLPVFSREYPCHSATEKDWYRLTVLPIGAPHPTGAVIMHVSVTATKKVEASLSESEAQFHQMAESIRDVFFLVDTRSKRVLYISPAYEELFGHGCAGMYAHSDAWLATVSPATRSRLAAEYRAHTKTSNIRFDCVFEIVRPDQTLRWVALKVFSIRDEAGKVTRIAGVAEDITDTKHAARAVQESEFRMRALLNNIGLVSVMLDCVEKITFCNEAFLRLSE